MGLMTEEQLDRYEAFRRSAINPGKIKRVSSGVLLAFHCWQGYILSCKVMS